MKRFFGWIGALALVGALGVAALVACGRFSAAAEVVANLRWPLGLSGFVGALAFVVARRGVPAVASFALGVVLVWPAARLWWPSPAGVLAAEGTTSVELRVATTNLLFGRVAPSELEAFVEEFQPDVIGLLELLPENRSGTDWFEVLEGWRERFPHQVVLPGGLSFGMALLSRYPLEEVRWLDPPGGENIYAFRPALLRVVARIDGRAVRLILTHPERPGRPWRVRARAKVFDAIVEEVLDGPTVVFGDLNCTEGSPLFQDLLGRSGLTDSRAGFGPCASWTHERVPGRWVTLDHVLVRGLGVVSRGVGRDVGSDHLPATAILTLPARRE